MIAKLCQINNKNKLREMDNVLKDALIVAHCAYTVCWKSYSGFYVLIPAHYEPEPVDSLHTLMAKLIRLKFYDKDVIGVMLK